MAVECTLDDITPMMRKVTVGHCIQRTRLHCTVHLVGIDVDNTIHLGSRMPTKPTLVTIILLCKSVKSNKWSTEELVLCKSLSTDVSENYTDVRIIQILLIQSELLLLLFF